MRLSCDSDDPGYREFRRLISEGKRIDVYVDDKLLEEATIADEEEGFAVHLRCDVSGKPVLNADRTAVETERVTGKVRIEVTDKRSPA